MRTRSQIYDNLLTFQAALSADLEQPFFRDSPTWSKARRVVDFGAGNGRYASQLAARHEDKVFLCIDQDEDLVKLAAQRCGARVKLRLGSTELLRDERPFDFLIARHAVSYLTDRSELFRAAATALGPGGGFLIVDAVDEDFLVHPRLPLLERGNEKFKEEVESGGGGRRHLLTLLPDELREHSFRHLRTRRVVVHSDIIGRRELAFLFMRAVAQWDHGHPLPEPVVDELEGWISDPASYLQFGLFGSLFERD